MIVDGKAIAASMLERVRVRAAALPRAPKVVAIITDETPATRSYIKIKTARAADAGCIFETRASTDSVEDIDADAVVVQLPVRDDLDVKELCDRIPLHKDADVLSARARARFERADAGCLLPPVVGAVKAVLESQKIELQGRKTVVVGQGFLVGAPVATWLEQQGAHVTVVTEEEGSLQEALANAELIVLGAGSPGLVTPDMLPDGVVLIDAGTSELGGKIVGDADPACAEKCSLFTPVPGGIGPIAVACLFDNVVSLCEQGELKGRNA